MTVVPDSMSVPQLRALLDLLRRRRAAVAPPAAVHNGTELVCCYVSADGSDVPEPELQALALVSLPVAAVPTRYVRVDRMPRSGFGKLDHQRLIGVVNERATAPAPSRPARSPVERWLATIWAEVLDVPEVGAEDDFFALGGNSLRGIRVLAQVSAVLDRELSLPTLFNAPTVAALASAVTAGAADVDRVDALAEAAMTLEGLTDDELRELISSD